MELFEDAHRHNSESLVTAGMLQLLECKTLADVTVAELCQRSGVSRATYYRHFADKRDVVFSFFDRVMRAATADGSTQTQPELYLQRVFSAFHRCRAAVLRLHARGLTDILDQLMRCHFGRLIPSLLALLSSMPFLIMWEASALTCVTGSTRVCRRHPWNWPQLQYRY